MEKIGIFWGSTTDNTRRAATFIQYQLALKGFELEMYDIATIDIETFLSYNRLIIGCSTWHLLAEMPCPHQLVTAWKPDR